MEAERQRYFYVWPSAFTGMAVLVAVPFAVASNQNNGYLALTLLLFILTSLLACEFVEVTDGRWVNKRGLHWRDGRATRSVDLQQLTEASFIWVGRPSGPTGQFYFRDANGGELFMDGPGWHRQSELFDVLREAVETSKPSVNRGLCKRLGIPPAEASA